MTLRKIDKDMIDPSFKQEIADEFSNQINVLKEDINAHELEKATTDTLGHVMVDGTSITIDASGTISSSGGIIPDASTSQKGIVQLDNTLISTSITQAPTANALKMVNDTKANKSQQLPITATLLNGWSNTVSYYKDEFGVVHLYTEQYLTNSDPQNNRHILTLPVGYRPASRLYFGAFTYGTNGTPNKTGVLFFELDKDGLLKFISTDALLFSAFIRISFKP